MVCYGVCIYVIFKGKKLIRFAFIPEADCPAKRVIFVALPLLLAPLVYGTVYSST